MKRSFFNRIISFMLAFVMVCANLIMPIWSVESNEAYETNIGRTAKLNTNAMIYISDDPTNGLNFQNMLMSEKVAEYADMKFVIVDCYVGNGGYWYKVGAADGQTLPEELQSRPWIYQNDIPNNGYYEDALIVISPSLHITKSIYNKGSYGYMIGAGAVLNFNDYNEILISDDPTVDWENDTEELVATDITTWPLNMVVVDVHWVEDTTALWLKVAAVEGSTLPEKLQENPWVFQNETSNYEDEDLMAQWPDMLILTLPENDYVDQATGIKVSGDLPEGAVLSVTVPQINGEALTGVYDIKIYDANDNVWQPIYEGKTVTISFPVGYDKAGLTHIIDYNDAITGRSDLTFVPVAEIEDQALLQLLGPAMDAYEAVYGNRDYVAVEEMDPVSAQNGMASFEVNSFSIYIPFDGKHQDASTDWESYQGYSNVEEAKAAVEAGTAYMYKIETGGSLSINWSKGSNTIGQYYTIYIWENGAWQRSAEPEKNWLGAYKDQKSVSLSHLSAKLDREYWDWGTKYYDIKFTAANDDSAIDQIFYISYKDGDSSASNKTIILKIVSPFSDEDIVNPNNIPLYIGVDSNTNSEFKAEPLDNAGMGTYFNWYVDGGFSKDNAITPYSDHSNALFACESFKNSTLKQPQTGAVRAIVDHSGIITQNFINWSGTFANEIVAKLGKDHNEYTLLVYAVKATYDNDGNPTGYYIMCKLKETSSKVISYYTNTPYGFSESVLSKEMNLPAVQIVEAGSPYEIKGINKPQDGFFETSDDSNNVYKITFLGWSSEPNPHYKDWPETQSATDHWYEPEDVIIPSGDMQLYAVWKPENHYNVADIKFTCEILDEDGNVLNDGSTVAFKVDSRFKGKQYVICNEMGVPYPEYLDGEGQILYKEFADGAYTFSLQHGDFLVISQVPTLENDEDPYVIVCTSGGYYESESAAKTEFWITKAENTTGLFEAIFTARLQSYIFTWIVDGKKTEDTYYFGDTIEKPSNPTKNGYTFTGWSSEIPDKMPSEDLTIYATWSINTYNVTYDLVGGSGSAPSISYTIEDSIVLPSSDLQKDGCAFNGWKPKDTVGNWNSATTYNGTLSDMYGDVTLEAQWEKNDYTITYDYAGGALPSGTLYIGGYETGDTIDFYAPIRNGYEFKGWKVTSTDGSWQLDKTYMDGQSASGVFGNVTLTAQWTPITYTITYNLDGGTGNGVYVTTYTVETETFQIPNPVKQENEFLGWTGTGLSEATKNLEIAKGSIGDREYTATWGLNQYDITFVFDNGRQPQTQTAGYGSSVTLPNEPVKDGYIFGGWKVTSTDGEWLIGQVYTSNFTVLSGNVTLTAVWESTKTSMTISVNGASGYSFIFRINDGIGLDMLVVVNGGASVVINELMVGTTYNVTELSGWSWRHNVTDTTSITLTEADNELVFSAESNDKPWLGGEGIG